MATKEGEVVPVAVGALGSVTKGTDWWMKKWGVTTDIEAVLPCWEQQGS